MVSLESFVATVLTDIAQGMKHAQDAANAQGPEHCIINPSIPYVQTLEGELPAWGGRLIQSVDFDVAVTATEEKTKEGDVGIKVLSIGIGGRAESSVANTSTSRIKFQVPVMLPSGGPAPEEKTGSSMPLETT